MSPPSLSTRVLIALIAGLAFGLLLSRANVATIERIVMYIEPFGTLFVNAIRMTVIPLVVSLVVVGIAGADAARIARMGGRALLVAIAFLCLSGLAGALIAPPVFAHLVIDPAAVSVLRARAASAFGASASAEALHRAPGLLQWLVDLVPANPVRAAADGAMLPLIIFAVAFGLSLLTVAPVNREPVVRFPDGEREVGEDELLAA